jgi:enolase-phosphatase E1
VSGKQHLPTAILVDVEGTTSSISYVYEVLFPYARANLGSFLRSKWQAAEVVKACSLMAQDAGAINLSEWLSAERDAEHQREKVALEALRLMASDAKVTGLKELQGLIWKEGYEAGQLKSHVFPDVPPAFEAWHKDGIDIRIYSSGSVQAQKLFFGNTEYGDLTYALSGFYDTTCGAKREPGSYINIAKDMQREPGDILFLSDAKAELDAAETAGMRTLLVVRPGNAAIENPGHEPVNSFAEIGG